MHCWYYTTNKEDIRRYNYENRIYYDKYMINGNLNFEIILKEEKNFNEKSFNFCKVLNTFDFMLN